MLIACEKSLVVVVMLLSLPMRDFGETKAVKQSKLCGRLKAHTSQAIYQIHVTGDACAANTGCPRKIVPRFV